jgi:hypothetical protein
LRSTMRKRTDRLPSRDLNVHWTFPEFSLKVPWIFTEYSLNAHWSRRSTPGIRRLVM